MIPWITILGYILVVPLVYWPKTGWSQEQECIGNKCVDLMVL